MKEQEKEEIKRRLKEYCERIGSQNKAANTMRGVSSATISQILNNNWELITDDMFRKVSGAIGYKEDNKQWVVVETRGYKRMYNLLVDSQKNSLVFAVVS